MQFQKQQLELDMEQWTGTKLGKAEEQSIGLIYTDIAIDITNDHDRLNFGKSDREPAFSIFKE